MCSALCKFVWIKIFASLEIGKCFEFWWPLIDFCAMWLDFGWVLIMFSITAFHCAGDFISVCKLTAVLKSVSSRDPETWAFLQLNDKRTQHVSHPSIKSFAVKVTKFLQLFIQGLVPHSKRQKAVKSTLLSHSTHSASFYCFSTTIISWSLSSLYLFYSQS